MEEENKIIVEEITTDTITEEEVQQNLNIDEKVVEDEVIDQDVQVVKQLAGLNSLEFSPSDGKLTYVDDIATYIGLFTYTTTQQPDVPVSISGKISFNIASGNGIDIDIDETSSKITIALNSEVVTSLETIKSDLDQLSKAQSADSIAIVEIQSKNLTQDEQILNLQTTKAEQSDFEELSKAQSADSLAIVGLESKTLTHDEQISELQTNINNEITARENADTNLQEQLTTDLQKINNLESTKADKTQLESYSLKVDTGHTIEMNVDNTTYILTLNLKNFDGTIISTQNVDLPLESMIVNGRYDEDTKMIVLTLQSGQEISFSVADLISGLVPDTRTINGLSLKNNITLTPADIGALPNTTFIPTKTSDLTNDSGFISQESDPTVPDWAKQPTKPTYDYSEIQNTPNIPTGATLYDTTGQNTNGAMTQKATTDELNNKQSQIDTLNADIEELGNELNQTVNDLTSEISTANENIDQLQKGQANNDIAIVNLQSKTLTHDTEIANAQSTANTALTTANGAVSKNAEQDNSISALQTADGQNVKISGDQNITGTKNFNSLKISNSPVADFVIKRNENFNFGGSTNKTDTGATSVGSYELWNSGKIVLIQRYYVSGTLTVTFPFAFKDVNYSVLVAYEGTTSSDGTTFFTLASSSRTTTSFQSRQRSAIINKIYKIEGFVSETIKQQILAGNFD